jgi:ribosomal protein L10
MEKFHEEFPQIADEISNVALASYLGVTPVQLSRIKNK